MAARHPQEARQADGQGSSDFCQSIQCLLDPADMAIHNGKRFANFRSVVVLAAIPSCRMQPGCWIKPDGIVPCIQGSAAAVISCALFPFWIYMLARSEACCFVEISVMLISRAIISTQPKVARTGYPSSSSSVIRL